MFLPHGGGDKKHAQKKFEAHPSNGLGGITMTTETVDTSGLKSPDCIVKIIDKVVRMETGSIWEVWGDCPTFEQPDWIENDKATR